MDFSSNHRPDDMARINTPELADAFIEEAVEAMRDYCRLYREDWLATSRPFGFELIQRRNASALERFEEAKRRFDDFMAGRAATIEEFDEAAKPFGATQGGAIIGW